MTHPEINLSWVCLFLNPKGTLKNAENADFCNSHEWVVHFLNHGDTESLRKNKGKTPCLSASVVKVFCSIFP